MKTFLTAVVRDSGNAFSKPFPVNIKVFNSKGSLSFSHTELLTKEGTISKEFHVPADAPTGTWYANVTLPGEEQAIGRKEFYVEEFAAPRLFVEAEPSPKTLIGKDAAEISLSSRYVFGSPASGLRWEAEMRTEEREFSHADWKGFTFRDTEKKFLPEYEFIGSGKLDQDGRIKVTCPAGEDAPSVLDILVGASVFEGRPQGHQDRGPQVVSVKVLIGISLPEVFLGKADRFHGGSGKSNGPAPSGS